LVGFVVSCAVSRADEVVVDSLPKSLAGTVRFALGDPEGGIAALDSLEWRQVRVPGTWQAGGIPGHGTGWYRFPLTIRPAVAAVPLAFACDRIRDADEVYLDGVRVGMTGRFPPRYVKATLYSRVYALPPTLTSSPGPHVLLVRVHNPGPRGGGLSAAPFLGAVPSALARRLRKEAPQALLAASIAALGVFSLFLYLMDRRQRDSLFFFLFTSVAAIYIASSLYFWPATSVPLSLVFRLNFTAACTLIALFPLFLHRFFERPMLLLQRGILFVLLAGGLFCLFWPRVDDLYYVLPVAQAGFVVVAVDLVVFLVRGARRRVRYARTILAGTSILFLAGLHDTAADLGLWKGAVSFALGPSFLVFTILVLTVLADRVALLRIAATTDPLTGIANRAVLFERFALELARAKRSGKPLAVALLDLDFFKGFNDELGHVAGDRLLAGSAAALTASIRATDLAARYGGEEFVLLLPEVEAPEALVCFERVRAAVAACRVQGLPRGTTVSIGFTLYDPKSGQPVTPNALLRHADHALYEAKARGRDRIVAAKGSAPVMTASSGIFGGDWETSMPVRAKTS
jgi:diguanylate cyclase (GGDEF)-like protein